ncbi:MAG: ABC transporter ATP-binding protein [Clostridia bacterium]|nr:ABC transporter ATP-binding protein [Clostridia bacterium]
MRVYRKYVSRYKYPMLIAMLCVSMEAVCDLLGPTLMARIIDDGIRGSSMELVRYWGLRMLLATFVGAVFAVARNILASNVSQRIGADLRYDLFAKIMRFSESGADRVESGSLITRMTNDTAQVVLFIQGMMRIFLKAPVTCIGSIVMASMLNLRLSIVIYSVVAAVTLLIVLSMKLSYPRFARLQEAMDRVNSVVQEYLLGVRLIKAFGIYDEEEEKFSGANDRLMKSGISAQLVITFISPLMSLAVGVGTVVAIYLGSRLFAADMAGAGDVSAFTVYMAQILNSLMVITNVFNNFVRTKASTERIQEVLEAEEDFAAGESLGAVRGAVRFENVTFAYPGGSGVPALSGLSFEIEAGQSLAVIGPTGSGKSTLAWLLMRFYEADSGKIYLDGRDISGLSAESVRENIALAPQKAMLFSGSVRENLLWGDHEASEEKLAAVTAAAQAEFIYGMPDGLESILGQRGVNVSGGQKQRISIARALAKDAPVLILDDATGALDAITEARVRENLRRDYSDRTVITITQRCTAAMFADRILVLENGRRVGFGTHDELLADCATYRDIYNSQVETGKGA